MKVLVISGAFPPMRVGEAEHVFHLCQRLAGCGLDVHVLTAKKNQNPAGQFPFQVHPVINDWSWPDLLRLAMFIRRCSPDAVLLIYTGWIYNHRPMITFAPHVSKVLLPKVPFITQFEAVDKVFIEQPGHLARAFRKEGKIWAGKKTVDPYYGTLLRDSDRIIVLTDRYRAALAEHFPGINGKSVLIPPPPILHMAPENGRNPRQQGREALGFSRDDFVITYFGLLLPNKGIETLLSAFHNLSRRRSNAKLLMIGGTVKEPPHPPDYAEQLAAMAQQLGIDDKITWIRDYPSDSTEASLYLRAADACALPFDDGVVLNRSSFAAAAAHGLPIVTTRGRNLESVFVDRKNVLLCPPKDPAALTAALDLLISNIELRQQLRAGALDLAGEWFSWDKAVARTMEALKGGRRERVYQKGENI